MHRKDLISMGIWALGTAALLAVAQPGGLVASPSPQAAGVTTPKLTIDGCNLQFRYAAPSATSTVPSLEVSGENPGDQAAHPQWSMSMMVTPPGSPRSRTISMPTEQWRENGDIELSPGTSSNLHFQPRTTKPIATGSRITFTVTSGKQIIVVTPAPAVQQLAVAQRSN